MALYPFEIEIVDCVFNHKMSSIFRLGSYDEYLFLSQSDISRKSSKAVLLNIKDYASFQYYNCI